MSTSRDLWFMLDERIWINTWTKRFGLKGVYLDVNSNLNLHNQKWEKFLLSLESLSPLQTDATLLANKKLLGVVASVRLHVAKSLTGFKLCPTTPNNKQQGVQTDATCDIYQCWELLANIVCLFAWGFTIQATCDTA